MAEKDKYNNIVRDLEEVVGEEDIKALLKERDLNIYWGTATTGKPHLGYFVPIYKISDFLAAGSHVTILFADIHAYLDNMKSDWKLLKFRCEYYEFIIKEMLTLIGVPLDKLRFVRGSDYQLSKEYTLDMYRISALVTTENTIHAGAEVVRQVKNPVMSSLLYPILQALDEEYLKVDVQFGGSDQRKIFMFARETLPKIGYKKRAHLMNFLIPGLGKSGKMSSSEPNSKIDLDDSNETVEKKIIGSFSEDGVVKRNGLLAVMRFIIFRKLEKEGRPFHVTRAKEHGGDVNFATYKELEDAFTARTLASIDLKNAIISELLKFVQPLREKIHANLELYNNAYPEEKPSEERQQTTAAATIGCLDIRAGKVVTVQKERGIYKLQVDTGNGSSVQVCSDTVGKVAEDQLKDRLVLLICNSDSNLKVKGIDSKAMLLVAQSSDKKEFALVLPPEGTPVGEQVQFGKEAINPEPNISKKRVTRIMGAMTTASDGGVIYSKSGVKIETSKGVCTSVLIGATITSPGCV